MSAAKLLHFPTLCDDDGAFRKNYPWLLSDWDSEKWEVCDPVAPDNQLRQRLIFSGILGPRIKFEDNPDIIEDIKKSLVLSVELSGMTMYAGSKVRSLAGMLRHVNNLQRIYRELFSMGCTRLSDVTPDELLILKKRLSMTEQASNDYPQRLSVFFGGCDLTEIPIKTYPSNKNPSHVDMEYLREQVGLVTEVLRNCTKSNVILSGINRKLSHLYPEFTWKDTGTTLRKSEDKAVHKKHLSDILRALEAYYYQSILLDLFTYPLLFNPISVSPKADSEIYLQDDADARERTRNIPPDTFLTVMDRAVRWVVDYSEKLLALETVARATHHEYLETYSESEAGKLIGGWVRRQTSELTHIGKAAPFPLGGYKEGSKKPPVKTKYTDEFRSRMVELMDQGVSSSKIADELGLTPSQFDGLKAQVSDHRYSRNIVTTGISLNDALYNFLPLSCALIILAFTAGRESSVYGLRTGCIHSVLGSRFIRMFVPKTVRAEDDFPTVALVEKAVQVLEQLSKSARDISGTDLIFQFDDLIESGRIKQFRFDDIMPRFLDFLDIPRDPDGNRFKFSEHQFRRFFAIMYFYRYDDGDYESLAYHLRHTDWSMTERYLSEKESGLIFKEVEQERIASVALRAANGDRVSGAMADEFKAALAEAIRIEPEHRFERALRHVKADSLVIDFVPAGLCFGRSPGREGRSLCIFVDGDDTHVMTHKATETSCDGCPNLLACDEIRANHEASERSESVLMCSSPLLDAVIAKGDLS